MKSKLMLGMVILIFSFLVPISCEIFSGSSEVAGPGGLEASDGDYEDYIRVVWDTVVIDEEEEEEEERIVDFYRVQRSDDDLNFNTISTTENTWYYDYAAEQARYYYYRVYAVFTDFTTSDYSDSNRGYRIDALKLKVGDKDREYFLTASNALEESRYYEFMAQEDWPFTIETYSAGSALGTRIFVFSATDIEDVVAEDDRIGINDFALVAFKAPSSGKYFISIDANSDAGFYLSVWHH